MTQPPDWAVDTPSHPPVHTEPARNYQWQQLTQDQLQDMRSRLIDSILQIIVQAVTGLFIPGGLGQGFFQLEDWAGGLFGEGSPVDSNNLFNFIPQSLLGLIPYSHIGDAQPNLLQYPGFDTAVSVDDDDAAWVWDSLVGRAAAGSLKVVANGMLHELGFNTIPVAVGQQMSLTMYSKWSGLVYGGGVSPGDGTPPGLPLVLPFELGGSSGPSVGFPLTWPLTFAGGSGTGTGVNSLPLPLPFTLGATAASGGGGGIPIRFQVVRLLDGLVVGTDDLQVPTSPPENQTTWIQLGGSYTVPAGTDEIRLQVAVTAAATAGTVWFDDGEIKKTGLLQIPWINGLGGSLGELGDGIQGIINTIFHAITGFAGVDKLLEDIFMALQQIPFLNILGIGGPSNIGSSVSTTWDQLISGLVGTPGSGAGLADLFNVSFDVSSRATLGSLGWDILGIRNNRPMEQGLLSTSQSNFTLSRVGLEASAPTIAVTQAVSAIGFQRIEQAGDRGFVSWLGSGITSITACYINIWQMDDTGLMTLVHRSDNRVGDLSGSMAWTVYDMPGTLHVEAGDVFGIEITVQGAGTHSVVGKTSWLPEHPNVFPKALAATRNSGTGSPSLGTTIASGSVVYSGNVPWLEFGVNVGGVDAPHSPTTVMFSTIGSTTIPVPSWCNFIDVIAVGAGGGGEGCGLVWGEGGHGGTWNSEALERGVDIPDSTVILNVTVGTGGEGGSAFGGLDGDPGTASTVGGAGWAGLSAAGGAGGSAGNADTDGKSPGNHTHNGIVYAGGSTQGSSASNGAPPGGGGSGSMFTFSDGGNGAPGAVFIVFRQT